MHRAGGIVLNARMQPIAPQQGLAALAVQRVSPIEEAKVVGLWPCKAGLAAHAVGSRRARTGRPGQAAVLSKQVRQQQERPCCAVIMPCPRSWRTSASTRTLGPLCKYQDTALGAMPVPVPSWATRLPPLSVLSSPREHFWQGMGGIACRASR
jgi:hypothetical protein